MEGESFFFSTPADHRMKIKESKKIYKYLDLAKELKKMWNMTVTEIPIVVGEKVPKCLEKKLVELQIRGRIDTI